MIFKTMRQHLGVTLCLLWFVCGSLYPAFGQPKKSDPESRIRLEALIIRAGEERNNRQAVELADRAIYLADSMGENLLAARAYQISGTAWRAAGDYLKAYEKLQQAYSLFNALELHHQANIVKREIGETFRAGGAFAVIMALNTDHEVQILQQEEEKHIRGRSVFEQAMRLFSEAKSHFFLTGDSLQLAKTWNRMAATSFEMIKAHPSFDVLLESIEHSAEAFAGQIIAYPELIYLIDQTQSYLDSAATMAWQLNDHGLIISNENIRASLYNMEYKTEMSVSKYDEIIDYMNETGFTSSMPLIMINKARSLGVGWLNRYDEAIAMSLGALELALNMNIAIYITMAHELLHENYLALGDYEKAYNHYAQYTEFILQQQGTLLMLKTDAKEYEFQIRQRETEIQHNQSMLRNSAIMGMFIVLVFSFFLAILDRKNRAKKQLLNELNSKNHLINEQNEALTEANVSKDRLFSIIGHDLRSPFQIILGYSDFLKTSPGRYDKIEVEHFAGHIHQAAKQTLFLLDNLLHWARIQRNHTRMELKAVDLKLVSEEICDYGNEMAAKKNIRLINLAPIGLEVNAELEMLKTILRNLLGNAIKYTKDGGRITVSAKSTARETILCVEDNGIGMQMDFANSLFNSNQGRSKPGTSGETGTGLGLVVCKEFVEMHGGKIWVESTPDVGSKFCFSLPNRQA